MGSRSMGKGPLNRHEDLGCTDGLQEEFIPVVGPGWERKGMPGDHQCLSAFFTSEVGDLQPNTVRKLDVQKHKIVPTAPQKIGSAAHRSSGIDLIPGANQNMLDEELR